MAEASAADGGGKAADGTNAGVDPGRQAIELCHSTDAEEANVTALTSDGPVRDESLVEGEGANETDGEEANPEEEGERWLPHHQAIYMFIDSCSFPAYTFAVCLFEITGRILRL
eukprot:GHVU01106164.1.p1 GENE.GHVU01106164.1~~GHVU01106164.1.p1  ORF type:complete len:114 (-),score=16.81 GHVU01106164.1:411-752(-)